MPRSIAAPAPATTTDRHVEAADRLAGGSVQVLDLVSLLCTTNAELVVHVGGDGNLYLAHRFMPDILLARIDLSGGEPTLEVIGKSAGEVVVDRWAPPDDE